MRERPEHVMRGLILAASAVGAREAVVYLRGSFLAEERSLRGCLPTGGVEVRITRGEEGYIAGEETAVLEALEGQRAWPRPKPPLPFAVGFRGRPTLVQNVETLSRVPDAIGDPDEFWRTEATLVSLWGHVRRPGVYEVRLGTPLRDIVETCGEGATSGLGMIFPGGPSASPLRPEQATLALDPDVLRSAGSGLGTSSLLVLGAEVCPVSVGVSLASFFERESCGQCPPCTVGSSSLVRVLRDLEEGRARPSHLRALEETAGFMSMHGFCAHSPTAARVVTGLLTAFPEAVRAHMDGGTCTGRRVDPFAESSPERRAIEGSLGAP
jgi:NADH-quinone oxidoreductase subunit F